MEALNQYVKNSEILYFCKIDLEGNYTYISPYFAKVFDFIPEEIYGTSSLLTIYHEDHQKCYEVIEKCFSSPKTYHRVYLRKPLKSNEIVWTQWEFYLDTDKNEQPSEIICYGFDQSKNIENINLLNKVNKKLVDNEVKYKTLFETSTLGIILHSPDGTLYDVNEAFCKMVGIPREEITKYNIAEFTPTEYWEKDKAFINDLVLRNASYTYEKEFLKNNSKKVPVTINGKTFFDQEGNILIWCIAKDITERKTQEKLLSEQKELLEQTAHIAKLGGWELDVKTLKAEWTNEVSEIYGLEDDSSIYAENAISYYHKDDQPIITSAVTNAIEKGESYELELRLISTKGIEKWVRTTGTPVYIGGEIIKLKGIIQDITEKKLIDEIIFKQKELLNNQKELLEQTAHIAKLGGWEIDINTLKTEWTKEVYEIHDMEEGFDHNVENGASFYHPDDRETVLNAVNLAINEGISFDLELRFISAKNNHKWLRVMGEPIYKNGKIISVKGVLQDVTEKKKAEETIIKQKDLLKDISFTQSHLVRLPIANILGLIDLADLENSEEERYDIYQKIKHSVKQLDSIVQDIANKKITD